MDVLAHALWAGAAVALVHRRWPLSRRTAALTVTLAVAPDVPPLLPVLGWSVLGDGTASAVKSYAYATPGQEPTVPALIDFLSHNLHCVTHSVIVLGVITMLAWAWRRQLWVPLLGWWSHVLIDMFTHSADYYPSPVLWPITRQGFDGIAWNTPWFWGLNYVALMATYLWLWLGWRHPSAATKSR